MAMDPLLLDQQLCFALYNASRAMTRAYAPLLEPLGLTYPQYLVMLVLWEADGISVKQLGSRLGLDSGTLTPLVKRLEAQHGLVERRRDEGDERVVQVHLTKNGQQLRRRAAHVPVDLACKVNGEGLTPAALKAIARLRDELHALTARLDEQER